MAAAEYEVDDVTGDTLNVLRAVLANFSLSPLRSGKRLRDLLASDYFGFREAALLVLREPMDVRGLRYLITLLWTNDMLIAILGDVTLPKEASISISHIAAKVDTQFHIRLIRFLVTGMLEGREVDEKSANRLLEVLGSVSDSITIQGFLRQMLRHPNPRIRSKITLLVGNGGTASRAIRKILADAEEDFRVRANALEAMWSNRDPEILDVFREMLEDPNNRVAGNAALGLYLAGDPTSIAVIRKMAGHSEHTFQQTAAWVIGKTEDPRFLPDVGRLMGKPNESLRKAVFRSIAAIKAAAGRRAKNPPLEITITDAVQAEAGQTRIRLSLSCSGEQPSIPPTGFSVLAGGKSVEQFSCVDRRNAEMCTAFLFPRRPTQTDPLRIILRETLAQCLENKRLGDRWLILRYQESTVSWGTSTFRMLGQTVEETVRPPEKKVPLTLTAHVPTLRTELDSNGLRSENIANVFQGVGRVVSSVKGLRSARYILALVDSEQAMDAASFEELAKAVRAGGVAINAISTMENSQMEQLCQDSFGVFHLVSNIAAIGPAVKLLYQSFKSEYLLEFVSPSPLITLQAYNDSAFGETALDLGPPVSEPLELAESSA